MNHDHRTASIPSLALSLYAILCPVDGHATPQPANEPHPRQTPERQFRRVDSQSAETLPLADLLLVTSNLGFVHDRKTGCVSCRARPPPAPTHRPASSARRRARLNSAWQGCVRSLLWLAETAYPDADHHLQTSFEGSIQTPTTRFPRLLTFVPSGKPVALPGCWLGFALGRTCTS
jgi:hypothetical protein